MIDIDGIYHILRFSGFETWSGRSSAPRRRFTYSIGSPRSHRRIMSRRGRNTGTPLRRRFILVPVPRVPPRRKSSADPIRMRIRACFTGWRGCILECHSASPRLESGVDPVKSDLVSIGYPQEPSEQLQVRAIGNNYYRFYGGAIQRTSGSDSAWITFSSAILSTGGLSSFKPDKLIVVLRIGGGECQRWMPPVTSSTFASGYTVQT